MRSKQRAANVSEATIDWRFSDEDGVVDGGGERRDRLSPLATTKREITKTDSERAM